MRRREQDMRRRGQGQYIKEKDKLYKEEIYNEEVKITEEKDKIYKEVI